MTINIAVAYLTRKGGVLRISQKGKSADRIDNAVISLDNNNLLTLMYNDYNYRWNYNLPRSNWRDEKDFIPLESCFSIDEVLPEYIEKKTYIAKEGFWNKKIEKEYFLPKEGLIRLNKPAQRVMIKCSAPYDIEAIRENIDGKIPEPTEIYKK